MKRAALFVDGSNLHGVFQDMQVDIDDYAAFYRQIFHRAIDDWMRAANVTAKPNTCLLRVYWYTVGAMDEWDLDNEKARTALRDAYDKNRDLKAKYMAAAGGKLSARPAEQRTQELIAQEAWSSCFEDISRWYASRSDALASMRRFYHAVRSSTDLIDVKDVGHWKVDMLGRRVIEKGLDASLAVDMVSMIPRYDIAIVISGDADMLPSIRVCKEAGKHVGVVEFLKGYPPENRGSGFSSRLRLEADFVTRVYEMDLIREGLAKRRESSMNSAIRKEPAPEDPATTP